jgi:hypothetical protein
MGHSLIPLAMSMGDPSSQINGLNSRNSAFKLPKNHSLSRQDTQFRGLEHEEKAVLLIFKKVDLVLPPVDVEL